MKNIQTTFNRKQLNQQEIEAGQNFEKILSSYSNANKSFYKTPKFYLSIITVGVIIGVMMIKKESPTQTPPFVNPPVKGVNIEYTDYILNPASDTIIEYKTGSVIYIPKDAFVDKDGKPINKSVHLKYREMHNPADFFISGIPMTYDSAGTEYHFESAGMIDIIGTDANGNPIAINPDAPIHIGMASQQKEDKYNIYYLDTNKRNWVYISKDTSSTPDKTYRATKEKISQPDGMSEKPIMPKKLNPKRYHFNISVNYNEFPEISTYKNVLFEVDENESTFKPAYAKTTWENVIINRGEKENDYLITFSRGEESHTFLCHPVIAEKDYTNALNVYKKKFIEYQEKLNNRREKEALAQEREIKKLNKLNTERVNELEEERLRIKEWIKSLGQKRNKEDIIFRTFQVNNFGIWNCDYPSALPSGANVIATFVDEKNNKLDFDKVYLVEKGRNAIFTYNHSALNAFKFDPTKENIVWGVTYDNKLAYIKPDAFKNINSTNIKCRFSMSTTDKTFTNYKEVKEFLNI